MAFERYIIEEVADDHRAGILSRREALRRLALLGLGAGAATSLLAACAGDDGAGDDGAATAGDDATSTSTPSTGPAAAAGEGELVTFPGPRGELRGSFAAAAEPKGAVLVIHENRGLTPHFVALPARLAADGYTALAVDLLSEEGGTPALGDEAQVQQLLSAAPTERLVADLRAGIDELARRAPEAKLGAMGFCFGGGMTWQLLDAGESRLAAAVPFYGPLPQGADFSGARAAVLAIYGELDGERVNGTRDEARAALERANLPHEIRTFAGADHAFFNDTGARYNEAAAKEAYALVLDWYGRYLA